MLQAINDRAKGVIGWIIIIFISIPFALWGIQEYVGGAPTPFAVKVDDAEISVQEFEQAVARQKKRLQSLLGDKLPTNAAFENSIKQQVLDQLIARSALEKSAVESGFQISDELLANKIQSMQEFQQDGKFMVDNYRQVVNAQGMSIDQFEALYRRDLMVQQLQSGLTSSTLVGEGTLKLLSRLQKQSRDVSYLLFRDTAYATELKLTDEELKQYFAENQDRYMHPEQMSISYLELKADSLMAGIEVNEEEIIRQYDDYVASLADKEQRKARHILIGLAADADEGTQKDKKNAADEALKKLQAGESFEELAKQLSEDPGSAKQGGDLGWVSRGMMVPAFENALYKLQKGQLSAVVKSGFGYHIIKLDEIKASKPESFEKRRVQLVNDAKQLKLDNIFYERSEEIATLSYENDETLLPVADTTGIKIQQSSLFTRSAGQGIASHPQVRKAAFQETVLKQGRNSEVIELGRNHIVVLRLDQHKPTKPKSLDTVKRQVEASLKAVKGKLKAQGAALQALAELQTGTPLKQLAKDKHNDLKQLGSIKRDHKTDDSRLVDAVFKMNKPPAGKTSYKTVELPSGVAVIALHKVNEASGDSKPEELQALARQMTSELSNQELVSMLEYLKSQSSIVTAKDLF